MTYQPHHSEDVSLKTACDNPRVLCQDCDRKLFRWFLGRIDWRRILAVEFGRQRLSSPAKESG